MTLKLAPLPDRSREKMTFAASPELKLVLSDYAEVYRQTYGQTEEVAELIPFMLEAFLSGDLGFKRALRQLQGGYQQHQIR